MISKRLTHFVWYLIQDHRRNRLIGRFAILCKNIHRAYEHPGHELPINGEVSFLKFVKRHCSLKVIFDVGANVGDWTIEAHQLLPDASMHLFEIAPPTFDRLRTRFQNNPKLILNNIGLSSVSEEVTLNYCPEHSELSSAEVSMHAVPTQQIKARTETGDAYIERHGISGVDLIKIDTEGMELKVLQGFARTLSTAPPMFIQFEHFAGRAYLKDFYDMLVPLGYTIGKLYSKYVDFRDYDISLEDGIGPNYIAAHSSAGELISKLKVSLDS